MLDKIFLSFLCALTVFSCSGLSRTTTETSDLAKIKDATGDEGASNEQMNKVLAVNNDSTLKRVEPPPFPECMDWTPKKLHEGTSDLLKELKEKNIGELKSVECFEKAKTRKKGGTSECQEHECLAWIEYWMNEGKYLYKQMDMEGALSNYLKAAKLVRVCRIGGMNAANVFLELGMLLIDGFGEIFNGSLAFKWAILFKWDIKISEDAPPNVRKTFDIIKQSMGSEPFSCVVK